MERDTVIFYRSDNLANAAIASFIVNNEIVEAKQVTFTNDDYIHDFIFKDMGEREWWGVMCGIRLTTRTGKMVIFASWEDTSDFDERYTFEEAFNMFIRALSTMN